MNLWAEFTILLAIALFYFGLAIAIVAHILTQAYFGPPKGDSKPF